MRYGFGSTQLTSSSSKLTFHSQEWSAIFLSFSLSPEIYHTVWRTWHLIACSDESWLNYQFSLHHSYICSWMVRRICIMSLGVKGLNKRVFQGPGKMSWIPGTVRMSCYCVLIDFYWNVLCLLSFNPVSSFNLEITAYLKITIILRTFQEFLELSTNSKKRANPDRRMPCYCVFIDSYWLLLSFNPVSFNLAITAYLKAIFFTRNTWKNRRAHFPDTYQVCHMTPCWCCQ